MSRRRMVVESVAFRTSDRPMNVDLACTIILIGLLAVIAGAYAVRVARAGSAHHARVDAEGKSALLSKSLMEMLVWAGSPVVQACVRLRITPDAVTYTSLVLGIAAGTAFGTGHFGVGALLATAAAAGDAVDGLLARKLGVGSPAGELLDAAVDRYVDFSLLAGVAFWFRGEPARLLLALFAMLASFMVSYSTAKAEAMHVKPPRGSMRRVERAVLLVGAAMVTPLVAQASESWAALPMVLALGMIALIGNASAVQRLACVRERVRERERERERERGLGVAE
ncbi:MAG: CDP-diacylglycerol--glycerol-3-phosphate 3-phosphatidyltransferase [Myxococcaceae bacterium]|nr:CDP-diacylglycerol--glycerol-3-phosphate 3-phosphatidyltransferase [Myxococcaceae bacterium]MEA2753112.1 CDP-diacylglycerol---glycerol-3-phosphate 3-phosphatidyltransferase [Myxococcales bacterium]